MFRRHGYNFLPLFLLITVMALSGCASLIQPAGDGGTAALQVVTPGNDGLALPNTFVDPVAFKDALLQALNAQDTDKLQMWMTDPIFTGAWRADLSDTSPADAVNSLYTDWLGSENNLALVNDVDLQALMGGKDPLTIPDSKAGVTDAFLVSSWGRDGLDEAILFVARQADGTLKLHGWMVIQGGFSGARLGGIQPYQNEALGFSLYLPKGYNVAEPAANYVPVTAPQVYGAGHPGGAYLTVEPANGSTSEQIAQQVIETTKVEMGPGYIVPIPTVMGIDGEQAYVIDGLPGQDVNRQLFMVHEDRLYHVIFSPDDPQNGVAYRQMADAYAMFVNTFHFTK